MRRHPILESARLVGRKVRLEPHGPQHADEAFRLIHDEERILRWLVWQGPRDRAQLEDYYRRWIHVSNEACDYYFAILEQESDALVGSIGLRFLGHPGTGDIGYWLGVPYWGRGYMTEALRLLVSTAFAELGAEAISAHVFVGNTRSCATLERIGFRALSGGSKEGTYFCILPEDWQAQRGSWSALETVLVPQRSGKDFPTSGPTGGSTEG